MRILLKGAQNINKDHLSKQNSHWTNILVQNRQVVILHRLNLQIFQMVGQNLIKFRLHRFYVYLGFGFWTVFTINQNKSDILNGIAFNAVI